MHVAVLPFATNHRIVPMPARSTRFVALVAVVAFSSVLSLADRDDASAAPPAPSAPALALASPTTDGAWPAPDRPVPADEQAIDAEITAKPVDAPATPADVASVDTDLVAAVDVEPVSVVTPAAAAPAPATADPGLVGIDRAHAALHASVPPPWLAVVDPPLRAIPGSTSLAWYDANWRGVRSEISQFHLDGDWDHLRFVVVHEWAHHIAFTFGSRAAPGAAPVGFPGGTRQAERWADCAATAITGIEWVPPGHGACTAEQLAFAADWFDRNLPA